ncbi:lipase 1 [Marmoricola endophyticus]|uniref:Lipase 1 n=1 Tax=Marmoricola endophyticus TaxID=2040280 RepID=A0A917F5X2_9ACTN|nr:SGNH/GDSL hydrolase family protein [Marmoricola endophyticus]GGF46757.1 lipase 1 [Marmoricola endophyticus]
MKATLGLGCAAGALLATAVAVPVQAAAPSYVALGDSYSSGVGTRAYLDDGTACQRSTYAYPSSVAAAKGWSLNFRACSGATAADVTSSQPSALSASTSYVTLSVGGNDAGFADVITECALPAWASDCAGAVSDANAFIRGSLPGTLRRLYASIRSRAPKAKVAVVGYPRLFQGEDCNAATFFSPEDESSLNATADLLENTLRTAASGAGFSFVDPRTAFTGHAVCDDPEWLNGFSDPVSDSYHPNRLGHSSGYTPLIGPALGSTSVAATPSVLAEARAQGPALASQQRAYAARDRTYAEKGDYAPQP